MTEMRRAVRASASRDLRRLELHFPVSPDRFLYLETDDAGGGVRIEGQRAGPVNARWLDEAVARHRGRWYLLLPALPHGRG